MLTTKLHNIFSIYNVASKRRLLGFLSFSLFAALLAFTFYGVWLDRPVATSDPYFLNKDRLLRHADKGDAESQYLLGDLYFTGHTVKADEQTAVMWYTKAAKQGHPLAQYQLGMIYSISNKDDDAFTWFKKAADQNVVDAQTHIGNLYIKGTSSVKPDGVLAFQYFLKAANQGDSSAMHNLAQLYRNGAGVMKDNTGALVWLQLAISQEKNQVARDTMGKIYAEWLATSTKKEIMPVEKAVDARLAKGFKREPVADASKKQVVN